VQHDSPIIGFNGVRYELEHGHPFAVDHDLVVAEVLKDLQELVELAAFRRNLAVESQRLKLVCDEKWMLAAFPEKRDLG